MKIQINVFMNTDVAIIDEHTSKQLNSMLKYYSSSSGRFSLRNEETTLHFCIDRPLLIVNFANKRNLKEPDI